MSRTPKSSSRRSIHKGAIAPGVHIGQPERRRDWTSASPAEILARHPPGRFKPLEVLEVLIKLFNANHTALDKKVSHKTRHDRAAFLRRFFRDLKAKAGFRTLPDPRNLGYRHVQAMARVWQQERLAPATIQTYLSFLRGLALWLGKPGLVREPEHFGLRPDEYRRHEAAERDRSWSGHGIDVDSLIERIADHDRYVGAQLAVMRTLGLRRKEAVMLRPRACTVPFEALGLLESERAADFYVRIKAGAKGGRMRLIPLDSPLRLSAMARAEAVAEHADAHLGNPSLDLKQNLRRFNNVLARFGLTWRERGATGHGLRHEAAHSAFEAVTGEPPPVRGGGPLAPDAERAARLHVAELAGHARLRASSAYLGAIQRQQRHPVPRPAPSPVDAVSSDPPVRVPES
ncbi:integrase domain-containing protein [Azohydromonas australica]|uniref:integrase domain-containing protein n=1 Tax=Azohydromonas australica TaxID=364039 RepID=UPI0004081760|nr:integrase domain-containing protein [Azohydromonas australica]